jgi:hypothetical protein
LATVARPASWTQLGRTPILGGQSPSLENLREKFHGEDPDSICTDRRGKSFWAAFYMPLLSFALSLPLILTGGWFRPALGVVLIVLGGWGIWKQISSANTAMRPPSRTGP